MIIESVRKLLGEDLSNQVMEKLKGAGKDGKDLELAIGNDGSFISADKYEALKAEHSAAEKLAKDTADQLTALKAAGDPDALKTDLMTAQQKLAELQQAHLKEVQSIRVSNQIALQILDQVHDPSDILGQIDLEKVVLGDKGEIKGGLEDQLGSLREKKPHWFKQPDAGGPEPGSATGIPPINGGKSSIAANPWKRESFNLTEQGRILRDNPELATKLQSQAN